MPHVADRAIVGSCGIVWKGRPCPKTGKLLQDIAHLGHVELLTPKPAESLWYFRDLLGMAAVHEEGQSVYLRGFGDYAATTLKLTEAEQAGVGLHLLADSERAGAGAAGGGN